MAGVGHSGPRITFASAKAAWFPLKVPIDWVESCKKRVPLIENDSCWLGCETFPIVVVLKGASSSVVMKFAPLLPPEGTSIPTRAAKVMGSRPVTLRMASRSNRRLLTPLLGGCIPIPKVKGFVSLKRISPAKKLPGQSRPKPYAAHEIDSMKGRFESQLA